MRIPIRRKLVLAIGVPLVLMYAGTAWVLAVQLRARSRDRFERVATDRIRFLAGRLEPQFDLAARAARLAAAVVGATAAPAERVGTTLAAVLGAEPGIARLRARLGDDGTNAWEAVRTENGVASVGPAPAASLPSAAAAPWPPAAAAGRFSPAYLDASLGGPATTFAARIAGDDSPAGTLLADVPFSSLVEPLAAVATEDLRIVLVARDGTVLWSSLGDTPSGQNLFRAAADAGRSDLESMARGIREGKAGIVRAPGFLRTGTVWFGHAPLTSADASIVAAIPEAVGFAFEREQARIGLSILTAGLVLILAAVLVASAAITRPISSLARAVSDLGRGDLDAHVAGVESRDEIGDLARGFDRMVQDLKGHVAALQREAAAREAVLGELRVAREIQTALLPKKLPSGSDFSLHARNLAARHVAGDFYDAFPDRGRVVFLVADVSGKGLPSALFMAVSRIVLRRALVGADSLASATREASDSLESEAVGSMYLTMFVGSLDPATGSFRYVNAGHPLPWRVPASGPPRTLGEVTGPPVGLLPGRSFEEKEEMLEPGDRLVVFTDGVPEARRGEEFYGDERLEALLGRGPAGESAASVSDRVVAAVDEFQEGNLADDVTVLVLGRA